MLFKFRENDIENQAIIDAFKELSLLLSVLDILPISSGAGTPESSIVAGIGSLYLRTDGSASTTLYVKESGVGDTGWIAK